MCTKLTRIGSDFVGVLQDQLCEPILNLTTAVCVSPLQGWVNMCSAAKNINFQVLVGHEEIVTCCVVADDESMVISGSKDSQIIIWNISTGNAIISLKTNSPVSALTITADAAVIISGCLNYLYSKAEQ